MDSEHFHRVITAFADHSGDLRLDRDSIRVQVLDELIEASFRERDGEVFVTENGAELRAHSWIRDRVARMPFLADRIQANIPREESFVPPPGTFLDRFDDPPSVSPEALPDARRGIEEILARPASDRSTVLYLTSDSGEGKTTLINHLAHEQARRFQARESSFLLVPIRLAGRSLLSFDQIVIAELVSRLRVPFYYYDAFMELVKMRVLVPAFDGFEERVVESSIGEAAYALGDLLHSLDSSGSVLLSARRAFFEYRNLETQAKLFDAIGDRNVGFAQIRLEPWNRTHFVEHARKRSVADPERVYDRLRQHFDEDHPSLTRALLVRRLLDVSESGDLEDLLRRLGSASSDYFHEFVNALVSREAQEWTEPSEPEGARRPLLSVAEHHSLLAEIAMKMWRTKNDTLSMKYLDTVTREFVEVNGKPRQVIGRIRDRIPDHALLARAVGRVRSLHFDHEDFRHLYLGDAFADLLRSSERPTEVGIILGSGPLARVASDGAANALVRRDTDVRAALDRLHEVARHSLVTYAQENLGAIASRLLELGDEAVTGRVFGLWFPSDALKGREFGSVVFQGCRFQGTSLAGAALANCTFVECRFERLEMPPGFDAGGALLKDCRVDCVVSAGDSDGVFDPEEIAGDLEDAGFRIERMEAAETHGLASVDPDARLAERALRCFVRGTRISEEVLRRWLGSDAPAFFERVLPKLVEGGVLRSIEDDGNGARRRFGLAVRMSGLVPAVPTTAGSIDEFLATIRRDRRMARG